jgi:predicted NUDIX family phosphoesterase
MKSDDMPVCGNFNLSSGNNRGNDDRLNKDLNERNIDRKGSNIIVTSRFNGRTSNRLTSNSSMNYGQKNSDDKKSSSVNLILNGSNDRNNEDEMFVKRIKFSNYEIMKSFISDTFNDIGVSLFMSPIVAIITIFSSTCLLLRKPILIVFAIILFFIGKRYTNKKLS